MGLELGLDPGDLRVVRPLSPAVPDRRAPDRSLAPGRVGRGRGMRRHDGGFAFTPGEFEDLPAVNPVGLGDPLGTAAEVANGLGFLLLVIGTLTAIASIVVRFRRSRGIERQQLKWVTAGPRCSRCRRSHREIWATQACCSALS